MLFYTRKSLPVLINHLLRNSFNVGLFITVALLSTANAVDDSTSYAIKIDQLVEVLLKEKNISPNSHVNDDVFVRRIYLDVIGRIPTINEVKVFRNDMEMDKRSKLIDRLIGTSAYVSHTFNYWADVLRATSRMRQVSGANYLDFIKTSIRENKPYDQFVTEMLTATGPAYKHGNGATGYLLRDSGMPLDNLANTMQTFLGTSMVCAQCHDHPFDQWTQKDFYKLSAFNAGTVTNLGRKNGKEQGKLVREFRKEAKSDPKLYRASKNVFETLNAGVFKSGTGLIRLPHDYYNDDDELKPFHLLKAQVPFGPKVELDYPQKNKNVNTKITEQDVKRKRMPVPGKPIGSRDEFAQWVTSPENPMFAKTIVNRMWEQVIGVPLVGPVTDISQMSDGVNAELTKELVNIMKELKYDLQAFYKILYKTATYQRAVTETISTSDIKYYFQGPVLKRLSAEQMWDSLIALAVEKPEGTLKLTSIGPKSFLYDKLVKLSPEELIEFTKNAAEGGRGYTKKLIKDANMMSMSMQSDGDSMMATTEKTAEQKEFEKLRSVMNRNYKKIQKLKKSGDKDASAKLRRENAKKRKLITSSMRANNAVFKNDNNRNYYRASEMNSPAQSDHFLRRFGQSSRQQIDDASTESSVPQVLTLMNGKVEDFLISNQASYINRQLNNCKSTDELIEMAFLGFLCRRPTEVESTIFRDSFLQDAEQARKDIIWVLANSHEFMFKR